MRLITFLFTLFFVLYSFVGCSKVASEDSNLEDSNLEDSNLEDSNLEVRVTASSIFIEISALDEQVSTVRIRLIASTGDPIPEGLGYFLNGQAVSLESSIILSDFADSTGIYTLEVRDIVHFIVDTSYSVEVIELDVNGNVQNTQVLFLLMPTIFDYCETNNCVVLRSVGSSGYAENEMLSMDLFTTTPVDQFERVSIGTGYLFFYLGDLSLADLEGKNIKLSYFFDFSNTVNNREAALKSTEGAFIPSFDTEVALIEGTRILERAMTFYKLDTAFNHEDFSERGEIEMSPLDLSIGDNLVVSCDLGTDLEYNLFLVDSACMKSNEMNLGRCYGGVGAKIRINIIDPSNDLPVVISYERGETYIFGDLSARASNNEVADPADSLCRLNDVKLRVRVAAAAM